MLKEIFLSSPHICEDETIVQIRKSKIPDRAFDITSDRYLCEINADKYDVEEKPKVITGGLYNDTCFFDQNACASPHLIVWIGSEENIEKAKVTFWDGFDLIKTLTQIIDKKYNKDFWTYSIKKTDLFE